MATHSSTLAWKTPWMEEPGGLHGVVKNRTRLSNFTFTSNRVYHRGQQRRRGGATLGNSYSEHFIGMKQTQNSQVTGSK